MRVSLIAAVARNGVIGKDGGLPWRLAADLRRFKALTLGKPVVMGRRTFDSIGRPLPGRANIVVSRDPAFRPDGVTVRPDLDAALAEAGRIARAEDAAEIMVIGGGGVYAAALPLAGRIYLTEVHMDAEGEVRFPDFPRQEWRETTREDHRAEPGETADYSFVVLDRLEIS